MDAFFQAIASTASGWIDAFDAWVRLLPVSFAFGAGMLAAMNPCGFIMLPAFSAFYVSGERGAAGTPAVRVGRAAWMSVIVTVTFILTFGIVGVIASLVGQRVIGWSAWAGLLVGAVLVAFGISQLVGRGTALSALTSRVRTPRTRDVRGVAAFGIAYAVVSLGCTLPIFAAVVGLSLTGDASTASAAFRYLEYSAGMGTVLLVVAVGTALARAPLTAFASRAGGLIDIGANAVLVLAGAYVVWYWGGVV
ncbi:MAG: cytochrome c biogenesis CcdA family protein [Dehalococcoidia bacterium]